jgi:hypothetical protein
VGIFGVFQDFRTLFKGAFHADAGLAGHLLAKDFADLLKPGDLAFGLFEMFGEPLLQLRG